MVNLIKNKFSKNGRKYPSYLTWTDADPKDLLYISDLDGTLLSSSGSISTESIQRLNHLIDCGLNFTIATARNYDSAHPILKNLKLKIPAILFNGVYLTEFKTGRNVYLADFIQKNVVDEMLKLVAPRDLHPFIYSYFSNGEKHRVYYRKATNPGAETYLASLEGDKRLRKVDEYNFKKGEKVSGFLLIDKKKVLKPIYQELSNKFPEEISLYFAEDVSKRGYYWLQAYHQEANKATMIKILARYLKVPLKNVVVFGDFVNDLGMFKIAGRAIAVSNAIPDVKRVAHEIIGSNDNGSVINYLESLGFGKRKTFSGPQIIKSK
jgi:Cof subfamily protein (haloacid dehalogenase superfamily)